MPAGLKIHLRRVDLEGGFDRMAAENRMLRDSLSGREVSSVSIRRAVGELQRRYAAKGYVLARVVLPPQSLADGGTLRVRVVDGFIEAVDVEAVPFRFRSVVRARLMPLLRRRQLLASELDRRVLLAGDFPGLALRSALVRGEETGGTRLVLEGKANRVDLQVHGDNELSRSLGRYQTNLSLAINSPLHGGEQWYFVGGRGLRDGYGGAPTLLTRGAGAVVPLGRGGVVLNPEYVDSRIVPVSAPGVPATRGDYARATMRMNYPVWFARDGRLDIGVTVERISQTLTATDFDVELNRDRYSAARLNVDGFKATPSGWILQFDGGFSAGLSGRDDSDVQASGLPTSHLGTRAHFVKSVADISALRAMGLHWSVGGDLHLQSAFGRPLFKSEQMPLDGGDGLSAFDGGSLNVDQGVLARGYLEYHFGPTGGLGASRYGVNTFIAYGRGRLFDGTVLDLQSVRARVGGVRFMARWPRASRMPAMSFGLEAVLGRSNVPQQRRVRRIGFHAGLEW